MKKLSLLVAVISLFAFSGSAYAINVTSTDSGTELASTILGSGITISNVTYTGSEGASGTFTDGSVIGIESGIILTSGLATDAIGPNDSDQTSVNNGAPGDSDLTNLSGYPTYNATVLEFDFESAGGDLFFNYVFASEEYNEFTNSQFNDVFAFFVDDVNIALLDDGVTPVSINTVNGGNPLGSGATNPDLYNNNDLNDGGPFFDIEYDGFTDLFIAQILGLEEGTHHIKLAIADASDGVLDSAVFIEAGSFSDKPTIPEPATMFLLGTGLIGLVGLSRKKMIK